MHSVVHSRYTGFNSVRAPGPGEYRDWLSRFGAPCTVPRRPGNSPAPGARPDDQQERSVRCGKRNKPETRHHHRPVPAVIREDRELLAELAQLNADMAAFALRVMEDSASTAEQHRYAQRLIAAGQRLRRRAENSGYVVIEGEVLADESTTLPAHTVEPVNHDPRR